ncbi:MAG: hypothetical protein GKR89_18645 [Candidatus Latescibacteria bacterium]|nr:hypothetical protein [Candidatus Latescibacterota bacterium]
MEAQANKELIRKILAEVVQGNVEPLFESISDEVVWEIPNPDDKLAISKVYQGRGGTVQFFEDMEALSEILVFEPQAFIAEDEAVVVIVHEQSRAKSTGELFEQDMVMVWTVRNGKIMRCKIYEDTYTAVKVFAS